MFTPENPPQDYDRLREAITACCTARPLGSAPAEEDTAGNFAALARELAENGPRCTIREAILAPQEAVPAEEALGRVCAMPTVLPARHPHRGQRGNGQQRGRYTDEALRRCKRRCHKIKTAKICPQRCFCVLAGLFDAGHLVVLVFHGLFQGLVGDLSGQGDDGGAGRVADDRLVRPRAGLPVPS